MIKEQFEEIFKEADLIYTPVTPTVAFEFGSKKDILVIRPTEEGSKTYEIDLTDKSALSNPGFYLMPNDVVYVKPANGKAFRTNLPLWSLILASMTTIIVLLQYFDN